MENFTLTVLLLAALALPVLLFLSFRPRTRSRAISAAALAVAAGWCYDIAFVVASDAITRQAGQGDGDNLAIAIAYGWVCPVVLVAITWLLWRLATRARGRQQD